MINLWDVDSRSATAISAEERKAGCTDEWMRSVVEFDILPMLGEYWFDEPDKLSRWEKNLRGVFDD